MTLIDALAGTADRLTEAKVEGVPVAAAAEAMRRETQRTTRLTASQRREVRSLQEDSGYSRAEAVAWVLAFGGES